jgi:hypothetical protein
MFSRSRVPKFLSMVRSDSIPKLCCNVKRQWILPSGFNTNEHRTIDDEIIYHRLCLLCNNANSNEACNALFWLYISWRL